ncbi:MAG TPA: type I-E CRISPR-associated protein Cse2/CasB [Anaeromyxobacteraceae bacterium]|jgi:CRISPR system Cascade subunit CasB|nr:type I-E CRISPR-associated protein Cse2/CasB [Anaeromyxobacteraceae bacterium]
MSEQQVAQAPESEQRSSAWRWWKSLEEDRAGRAELRRCGTPAEVAFTPAYHALLRRLGSRLREGDARRVAALAAILSHVEREPAQEASLARQMGSPRAEGQGSAVGDSRFRHILREADPEALMREVIRVVRQLDRCASVDRLVKDLMSWNEQTRTRWAQDFYEAAPIPEKK